MGNYWLKKQEAEKCNKCGRVLTELDYLSLSVDTAEIKPKCITYHSITKEFVAKATICELRMALNSLVLKVASKFKESSIFHKPEFSTYDINRLVDKALAKKHRYDPAKGHPFAFFSTVMDGLIRTRLVQKKRVYLKEPRKTILNNFESSNNVVIGPNDLA